MWRISFHLCRLLIKLFCLCYLVPPFPKLKEDFLFIQSDDWISQADDWNYQCDGGGHSEHGSALRSTLEKSCCSSYEVHHTWVAGGDVVSDLDGCSDFTKWQVTTDKEGRSGPLLYYDRHDEDHHEGRCNVPDKHRQAACRASCNHTPEVATTYYSSVKLKGSPNSSGWSLLCSTNNMRWLNEQEVGCHNGEHAPWRYLLTGCWQRHSLPFENPLP